MCQYQGHEFGASYPDSVCIDGRLWDADSDDGEGMLTSGGDYPCPRCNAVEFLMDALEEAKDGSCGESMWHPWCAATVWEARLARAVSESPREAAAFLLTIPAFETTDWPDREAVLEGRAAWALTVTARYEHGVRVSVQSSEAPPLRAERSAALSAPDDPNPDPPGAAS